MEMSSGLWCGCGAATLKPREAKVVQTRGTDKVSVGKAQRTCGSVVIQKGVKVSRLSGTESVMVNYANTATATTTTTTVGYYDVYYNCCYYCCYLRVLSQVVMFSRVS